MDIDDVIIHWLRTSSFIILLIQLYLDLYVTASVRNWNKDVIIDIPNANNAKSIKQINKLLRYDEDSRVLLPRQITLTSLVSMEN